MARTISADHDAKRGRILKAAAHSFAAHGLAGTSMARIAAECRLSKATLYHYYDSKDALLFDILDGYLSALRDRLIWLSVEDLSPQEALRRMVGEILLAFDGRDAEQTVYREARSALPREKQDILQSYVADTEAQLGRVLSRCAPTLEQDAEQRRAVSRLAFSMLTSFAQWAPQADADARARHADLVTRLMLGGVGAL
ncbi:TetR/AcrR family transcriptional regulator [Cognatishimia sp. F0-27]|uniref:TetR/AcrR family transcriptional regulator n=1 Tax=Cognatishimia sp. F0-27 TaxID=2816855 RepID=UPI001D0CB431|nr:TetR/AcrR family transcriptional regulator [Cognatishimia sp. F0-27]MCC1492608.1 TetR/AcrR family transcriptional regulator [Cognatishimia sp. F0-27]